VRSSKERGLDVRWAKEKGTDWFFNRDKVNLDIVWLEDDSLEDFSRTSRHQTSSPPSL
jgi:hypothetical protein